MKVHQALSDAGFQPWIDNKNILPGEPWQLRIEQAMRESDFVLLFLSQRSVQKRGVLRKEWNIALDIAKGMLENDIFLIPVRLEDCDMPPSLQHLQRVDLFQADGLAHLLKAIQEGANRRKKRENTTSQSSKKHQENARTDVTAGRRGPDDPHFRGAMSGTEDLSSMSQLNNIAALTELMDLHSTPIDIVRLIGELYSQHNIPELRSYDSVRGATKWEKIYNVLQIMQGYGRDRLCDVLQIVAKYRPSDDELASEVKKLCSRRPHSSTKEEPQPGSGIVPQTPSIQELLNQLAGALASLYPQISSADRLVFSAGLSVAHIERHARPIDLWYAIVTEAHIQRKLDQLFITPMKEYPTHEPLLEAYAAYVKWRGADAGQL
jgi:hypothetical protein